MSNINTRTESDLIGEKQVPCEALYGVQTLRGVENFQISNFKLSAYPRFINGLAYTKMGAAEANFQLGLLTKAQYDAIMQACKEILDGRHHEHFPVDMIQGGAGTTTNMNANEVIANRALEIMGHDRGDYVHCYPNDAVNRSQSTNDAYPCAIHLGLYATNIELLKHFRALIDSLRAKGKEFSDVLKMGRTQLEDAVPMTLGQTFNGFASILEDEVKNLEFAARDFLTVNMGATAIGTGICSEPGYAEKCVAALGAITGWPVRLASDLVGATSDTSCLVGYSGSRAGDGGNCLFFVFEECIFIEHIGGRVAGSQHNRRTVGSHIEGGIAGYLAVENSVLGIFEGGDLCVVGITSTGGTYVVHAIFVGMFKGVVVTTEVDDSLAQLGIFLKESPPTVSVFGRPLTVIARGGEPYVTKDEDPVLSSVFEFVFEPFILVAVPVKVG